MERTSTDDDPAERSKPPGREEQARQLDVDTQPAVASANGDGAAPSTVDDLAIVDPRAVIGFGAQLLGNTVVKAGARVEAYAIIEDSAVGAGAHVGSFSTVRRGSVLEDGAVVLERSDVVASRVEGGAEVGPNAMLEESVLSSGAKVGPFSRVRAGSQIEADAYVGTHAEVKASVIGARAKVGHFSFVGDCELGADVNIGAGAVTANWDGASVQRTQIGTQASIGAGTVMVAPVCIGAGARTGAGAVVVEDVPDGALVMGVPARLAARGRTSD